MNENLTQTQPSVNPQTPVDSTPVQSQKNKKSLVLMIIIHLIAVVVIGYLIYQNIQLKTQIIKSEPTPIASLTPTVLPSTDPTVDWKTYNDTKFNFSFKFPIRYKIEKPTQEAVPEGEFGFNAGSKEDRFWIDAVFFSGTLEQFVSKYTAYDSGAKIIMTNLNVSTPLGESVNQGNTAIHLYKYINHYDQNVNPGAKDIISYTGFFVSNNFGYILRSVNVTDNLPDFVQILSTFKFTQ